MTVAQWSTTPASNATINDATYGNIDWAENMSPSNVNDSARAVMAHIKAWYDNITAGGTITGSTTGSDTKLTLDSADDAILVLDKAASTDSAYIDVFTGGAQRWKITLSNATAESSTATGSDLTIAAYDNTAGSVGTALTITRSTLGCTFGGTVTASPASPADPATGLIGYAKGADATEYYGVLGYADTGHTTGAGVYGVAVDGTTVGAVGYTDGAGTDYSFYGNGNLVVSGTCTCASDRKLKTDLQRIEGALDKVDALTGYTFNRIDLPGRQTGLIAQDVQAVLPEAVTDNNGTLGLAYGNLAGLLVEAIKELRAEVVALKERLA